MHTNFPQQKRRGGLDHDVGFAARLIMVGANKNAVARVHGAGYLSAITGTRI
jgi:hypothetical protein